MAAKEVVSGVGVRYGAVFELDSSGLPYQATSAGTLYAGVQVEGIKSLSITDPEPQRITHYGDDYAFAQDSLAPTEVETFTMTTAKTNLTLDSLLESTVNRVYGSGTQVAMRAVNSDNRGNEPQVMSYFYRQALDTKAGSSSFGALRQWQFRIFPSARISPMSQGMEQTNTDKTYNATPSPVNQTSWAEALTDGNWGALRTSSFEGVMGYQPRIEVGKANGTITTWWLNKPLQGTDQLFVWLNGSLTTPGTIVTGTAANFIINGTTPVGNGTQIFVLYGQAA